MTTSPAPVRVIAPVALTAAIEDLPVNATMASVGTSKRSALLHPDPHNFQ
jgi:hypothetical protein